jgi:NADP-dependent 3-hydroxy acid dehydrogenase YdfG
LSAPVVPTVSGSPAMDESADLWSAVQSADADRVARLLGLADADSLDASVLSGLGRWWQRQRLESTVSAARYRVTWQPISLPTGGAARFGRGGESWWLLSSHDVAPWAEDLAVELRARGAAVAQVALPAGADREAVVAVLRGLTQTRDVAGQQAPAGVAPGGEGLAGVLWVPGGGVSLDGVAESLAVIQALGDAGVDAPLWALTSGAVSVGAPEPVREPELALVWGLGRVAALEFPRRWGGLIDLPPTPSVSVFDRLAAVLSDPAGEDQLALREEGVFVRRLVHAPYPATSTPATPWRPRGRVLVTGGTSAMGRQVAQWLADNGAEQLILTDPECVSEPGFEKLGPCSVEVVDGDLTDETRVRELINSAMVAGGLTAIVHVVGQPETRTLDELTPSALDAVLDQVRGLNHLDAATRDLSLDAFVVISSVAGVWGASGLGAHAAANAGLDAFAEQRAAQEFTVSLATTAWDTDADDEAGDYLRRHGITPLPAEHALAALEHALTYQDGPHVLTATDWEKFVPGYTATRPSPLLAELAPAPAAPTSAPESNELRERLAGLSANQATHALLDLVRTQTATILGHTGAEAVEPTVQFKDLGFDSATVVEFCAKLGAAIGLRLPPTVVYDYPKPIELARHLQRQLSATATDREELSILDELDRLESASAALTEPDEGTRGAVAARLRALLARWDDAARAEAEDLNAATADELFDLIHNEFGKA